MQLVGWEKPSIIVTLCLYLHDDVKTVGSMDNKCIDTKHLFDTLTTSIEERYERCTKNHLTRLYINCFSPNDNPFAAITKSNGPIRFDVEVLR